jgi:7-cyano-7-deazaguanine synthase
MGAIMILVLFSGGVDSMVLAEMARQKGVLGGLLFIGYSQPAISEEMRAARRYAEKHGYELHIIHAPVRGVHEVMAIGPGVDGLRILPGRNLVMISHALNVAKVLGCSAVWYWANAGDSEYPDCTPDFLQAVNHVGRIDTGITVSAPLIYKSKEQIVKLGTQLGLDLSAAWSCYEPTRLGDPCGECHSCKEGAPWR